MMLLLQFQLTCALLLAALCSRVAARMPVETQEDYLNHLYLKVKDRPLRNGELNLLPDGNLPGFANTVRCVPETGDGRINEMSRKMNFQRVMLKPSENLISVKLVVNLPSGFSEEGDVFLSKTSDNLDHNHLDRVSVPSCHSTCWFELNVGTENMQDNMELLLHFTHTSRQFIQGLNPMMVLYTYVVQPLPNLVTKRHLPNSMSAHHDQGNQDSHQHVNPLLSELESRDIACSKQTVQLAYSQMKWLGEDITIINPSSNIHFEFCYGHCNIPLDQLSPSDPRESYNKRARILEVMNQLSESRLTPKPCCVPRSYIANEVIYAVGELVALTTFPSVEQCGCRA